jgi:hypothetical protein
MGMSNCKLQVRMAAEAVYVLEGRGGCIGRSSNTSGCIVAVLCHAIYCDADAQRIMYETHYKPHCWWLTVRFPNMGQTVSHTRYLNHHPAPSMPCLAFCYCPFAIPHVQTGAVAA